jgi:mxaA protein
MQRHIFVLALLLWSSLSAAQNSLVFSEFGRSFGITVGDKLSHHYVMKCHADAGLIESSLPVVGELSYWLNLVDVKAEHIGDEDHCLYSLKLTYQTFYAPLDVRALQTPAFTVEFQDALSTTSLEIPAWTFTMSPIKQIQPGGVGAEQIATQFMQDSIAPSRQSTVRDRQWLALSLAVLFLSLTVFGWLSGWVSFGQGTPFIKAKKRIQGLLSSSTHQQVDLQQCLMFVHQAFNERAGYTVFSSKLDLFFEELAQFSSLRQEVEAFYHLSQTVFFFGENVSESNIKQAIQLCDRLAMSDKVKFRI